MWESANGRATTLFRLGDPAFHQVPPLESTAHLLTPATREAGLAGEGIVLNALLVRTKVRLY